MEPTHPAHAGDPALATTEPDALCCCTFAFADPLDYGVVATWDSLATTCRTGDADRFPGKCIDSKWCGHKAGEEPRTLADRPELAPRAPLPASVCCCDIFDGTGETFSVLDAATCKNTPDAHCVIDDFCPAPATRHRR
jgi:hypothetical protein